MNRPVEKYRELVDELHAAAGAVQALERRRSGVSLRLAELLARRERVPKPRMRLGGPPLIADTTELDADLAQAREEASRLQAAAEPLQARRNTASAIACRARDLLVERGLLHHNDAGF